MKNIIITGANGFVGSHILESFTKSTTLHTSIIAACRTPSKLPKWYKGETCIGDLSSIEYIEKLTYKADIICHTAAWAEMNGTLENSKKYFLNPTITLIKTALKNGVKRFIFLSAITSRPILQNKIHSNRKLEKIWPHYDSIIKIENYLKESCNQGMEIIILHIGFFTGKNYSLGILPILLPRLKTHLVPWIKHGKTSLPLINGKDIGLAFRLAATVKLKESFYRIDIIGKEKPLLKDVLEYLHSTYNYPLPHFNVSFPFAYTFARLMQYIHKFIPGDPLLVPAIVLLLEESNVNNSKAGQILGYRPTVHWKDSIDIQLDEMNKKQTKAMKMNK